MNPEINFNKNFLCNIDFEFEVIPHDKKFLVFNNIPCWTSPGNFEIHRCSNMESSMPSQCLELDPEKGGVSYSQSVNLTEGIY